MADILETYNTLVSQSVAPAAPAPTSNISNVSAVGVEDPVDNGKPSAESPTTVAESAPVATEEAKPTETAAPVVEAPKVEPKPDSTAKRFAMAAQKEKELRQRELEIQKKEVEFRRLSEQPKAPTVDPMAGIDPKKQPLTALNRLGLSLQDVQEAVLRGEKAPEVDPLDARLAPLMQAAEEVKALRAQLAQKDATEAQKQYEQQVSAVKQQIAETAAKGYDMVHALGEFGVNTVYETMDLYYKTYEKVLTYAEACDMIELHFESEFLPRLANSNKVKSKIQVPVSAASASASSATVKQPQSKQSPTLANANASMPVSNNEYPKTGSREAQIDWLVRNVVKSK